MLLIDYVIINKVASVYLGQMRLQNCFGDSCVEILVVFFL